MIVTFYGRITEYTNGEKTFKPGGSSVPEGEPGSVPGSCRTLRGLLDELGNFYGEGFKDFLNGNETCLILLNGNGVALTGGLDSPLYPGDKIDILPFVDAG